MYLAGNLCYSHVKAAVSNFGGEYVDHFSHRVTHLVVTTNKDGVCARTLKYALGVSSGRCLREPLVLNLGIPCVSHVWVTKSIDKGHWLPVDEFIVEGKIVSSPIFLN